MNYEVFTEEVIYNANKIFLQIALNNGENSITENVAGDETRKKELEIKSYNELLEVAEKEVKKSKKLKSTLCAALSSVSDDLTEVAKIVCASTIPLLIADKSLIPLNSLLFAGIAVMIYNSGISSFCNEYKNKSNEK